MVIQKNVVRLPVFVLKHSNRTKSRHTSAQRQQATSSTDVSGEQHISKFRICDSFVEYMISKHQQRLRQLSAHIRREAAERQNDYGRTFRYRDFIITGLRQILARDQNQYLVPVGSTASGLASGTSDIDLVYISTTNEKQREKLLQLLTRESFKRTFITEVKSKIEKSSLVKEFDWNETDIIHTARVPILHLQTKKRMQVDIQFEKYASIRNTYFVRRCSQHDVRVCLLNIWAQKWLETQRLKDSKHGLFSTYHVLMLVLHFLQCTGLYGFKSVLPVMCKKYRGNLKPTVPIQQLTASLCSKPKELNFQERQTPDVAELVLLFISHYAKYDFSEISLHLRDGTVTEKNYICHEFDRNDVSLFDPYASTSVCRVKGGADLLTNAFQMTKRNMLAGHCLEWPISLK
ncbi:unnamed protein product [Thelazia callipaeda]|uniref:NTP_transf_2 domain-containing protein n=1 Tax=Thelazia callipaeda TaxID=103827 RepID=A0A0N5D6A1_THECL|nr:unnamed protein product [Thelazia callipaeda]